MSTQNKYQFKGTPGPWMVSHKTDAVIIDNPKHDDADYYGGQLICESATSHNRRLIAAAPDLLEACIEMVAYEDRGRTNGEPRISEKYYNMMKYAINKALNIQ